MKLTRLYPVAAMAAIAMSALVARPHAQGAVQGAVPCPRPANAPPLVPVRLDRDGNFRIAPPYVRDAAFTAKPDVPKGRVIRFTMNSAESKIFPTAPVPAPRAGGPGRAGQAPGGSERQRSAADAAVHAGVDRSCTVSSTGGRRTGRGRPRRCARRPATTPDVRAPGRCVRASRIRAEHAGALHRRPGRTMVYP